MSFVTTTKNQLKPLQYERTRAMADVTRTSAREHYTETAQHQLVSRILLHTVLVCGGSGGGGHTGKSRTARTCEREWRKISKENKQKLNK